MTRIVRTAYRYKRPPRKRKPVTIEVPAVITAASKRKKASAEAKAARAASLEQAPGEPEREPARTPVRAAKAAIVTIRRQEARIIPPDLLAETPKEHRQRDDAADAIWRELVHRATGKEPAADERCAPPGLQRQPS
jgi:hypothetical protein